MSVCVYLCSGDMKHEVSESETTSDSPHIFVPVSRCRRALHGQRSEQRERTRGARERLYLTDRVNKGSLGRAGAAGHHPVE